MVKSINITPFNAQKPDYDFFGPIAKAFDYGRKITKEDELEDLNKRVGAKMTAEDLRGASREAFTAGDLKTGFAVRHLNQSEEDRAVRQQHDVEDRDTKARRYVSSVLSTTDPNAPDYAEKWQYHLGRLRKSGYNVPAEYDDPVKGREAAVSEIEAVNQSLVASRARGGRPERPRGRQRRSDLGNPVQTADAGYLDAGRGLTTKFDESGQAVSGGDGGDTLFGGDGGRGRKRVDDHNEIMQKLGGKQKPRVGHLWGYDENGEVTQVPLTQAKKVKPVDERTDAVLRAYTDRLNAAEKQLLKGSYFENFAGERYGIGKAGRAYEDFESAALGVVYAMSGKQTTNKEMERFLKINKPQASDTSDTITDRTSRIRGILEAITGNMKKGMPYNDAERAALSGSDTLDSNRGGGAPRGYEGMSDEDLLKELSK